MMDAAQRDCIECDVVIVGGGPAGLATAIALQQKAQAAGQSLNIIVLEKAASVGGHILSGAVIDPVGLNALFPEWRQMGAPVETAVTKDEFHFLGPAGGIRLPNFVLPKALHNEGNYIVSLGALTAWLGEQAQTLGIEIFPGFPAADLIFSDSNQILGVVTADSGRGRDGMAKDGFALGVEIRAKYTVLAEGARGSLTKKVISHYGLDQDKCPQKYGIGFKEVWEVPASQHHKGHVQHSFGWPLDNKTGGGGFVYHYGDNLVAIGFVVHLNYQNPYLSPFDEFQRYKTHPLQAKTLKGARRISYGARAISEGGWQSVPRLVFPGGALVGCGAGFMNVPRIKGSHNAILSGMECADALFSALSAGRAHDEVEAYETGWRAGKIGQDLYPVRNAKPLWSKFGTALGVMLTGADLWAQQILKCSPFGTLKHGKPDHACLKPANECTKIEYPLPDGILTFDKLSSVYMTNTHHEEDQLCHLKLADPLIPIKSNLPLYAEPAQRYCPAGVYEVVMTEDQPKFIINAQNCIHCKTCDIKDPAQNITWAVPEGGGGPNYVEM